MFRAVTAASDEFDTGHAIDPVLVDCQRRLGPGRPRAGLLSCTAGYAHRLALEPVFEACSNRPVCGLHAFGEMAPVAALRRARDHNTAFVTLLPGLA